MTTWFQLKSATGSPARDAWEIQNRILTVLSELSEQGMLAFFFIREPTHFIAYVSSAGSSPGRILTELNRLQEDGRVSLTKLHRSEPRALEVGSSTLSAALVGFYQADSIGWWRAESLRRMGQARVSAPLLSLTVLNDLFFAVLGAAEEVWDVWCRVAWTHLLSRQRASMFSSKDENPPQSVVMLNSLARHLVGPEHDAVLAFESANRTLAMRLESIIKGGFPIRRRTQLLPSLANSHFSRHALSDSDQCQVQNVMLRMLDPARGFLSARTEAVG